MAELAVLVGLTEVAERVGTPQKEATLLLLSPQKVELAVLVARMEVEGLTERALPLVAIMALLAHYLLAGPQ